MMHDRELVQAALAATVRVDSGAGVVLTRPNSRVVLTAAHVLRDKAKAEVTWPSGAATVDVLFVSSETDIAVLADRESMPPGLPLAGVEPEIGEWFVHCGFPTGWVDRRGLICRGSLSGVASDALWLNVDGTWGHSGGPIVIEENGEPRLLGLVLGHAGEVRKSLHGFRQRMKANRAVLGTHLERLRRGSWGPRTGSLTALEAAASIGAQVAEFVADHFRSGFLRATRLSQLRDALGPPP